MRSGREVLQQRRICRAVVEEVDLLMAGALQVVEQVKEWR